VSHLKRFGPGPPSSNRMDGDAMLVLPPQSLGSGSRTEMMSFLFGCAGGDGEDDITNEMDY
jgi:hypothetical protein